MWFQLKIEGCSPDSIPIIEEKLDQLNTLSVILTDKNDNPVLEPEPGTTPLWPEVVIEALFADSETAQNAHYELLQIDSSLQLVTELIEDKDWERVWMNDFKPQQFGQKLWICPTWSTPPDPEATNLILDPGLAFGTGTHPTTALCLTWLEQAHLTNKTVIDYGCGSGILSLAALKLGAKQIFAVDIDSQALTATKTNMQNNLVNSDSFSISLPDQLEEQADLIIANILLAPLLELKIRFLSLLKEHGFLIVSGILETQAPLLITTYHTHFEFIEQKNSDGWSLLHFKKT